MLRLLFELLEDCDAFTRAVAHAASPLESERAEGASASPRDRTTPLRPLSLVPASVTDAAPRKSGACDTGAHLPRAILRSLTLLPVTEESEKTRVVSAPSPMPPPPPSIRRRSSSALFERNESFPEVAAFDDGCVPRPLCACARDAVRREPRRVARVAEQLSATQTTLLLNVWDYLASLPDALDTLARYASCCVRPLFAHRNACRLTVQRWKEAPSVARMVASHVDEDAHAFVRRHVHTLVHCFRVTADSEAVRASRASRIRCVTSVHLGDRARGGADPAART